MMQKPSHHRASIAIVRTVRKPSILAATAAVALATGTAGIVTAAPALAYPPGTHMSIDAYAIGQPDRHKDQRVAVTVADGKPGCTVKITGGGDSARVVLDSNGAASATLQLENQRGTITITAKTLRCKGKGAKETATTTIHLSPGEGHGHDRCKRGHDYQVDADRWRPRRRIELVFTDGRHSYRQSAYADDYGHAAFHFTPNTSGRWAVILLQDGLSASYTVDVS